MKFRNLFWIVTFSLLVLAACQSQAPTVTNPTQLVPTAQLLAATQPEQAPTPSVTAKAGSATVKGRVLDQKTKQPLVNTIVRLADVYKQADGQGAYVLDAAFSPGTRTDSQGYFEFTNVDAKTYVIIVGDVYDVYKVVQNSSGTPKTWNTTADQVLDAGELDIDLTPSNQ